MQGSICNELDRIERLLGKVNIKVKEYGQHSKKTLVPQIYVWVEERIEEACEVLKKVKGTEVSICYI